MVRIRRLTSWATACRADLLKEVNEHLKAAQERKSQAMELERIRQEELEKRRKEAAKVAEKARDLAELRRLQAKWPGEA